MKKSSKKSGKSTRTTIKVKSKTYSAKGIDLKRKVLLEKISDAITDLYNQEEEDSESFLEFSESAAVVK